MIKKNIDKQDRKMRSGENAVKKVLAAVCFNVFAVSLALTGSALAQAKIQVGCTASTLR